MTSTGRHSAVGRKVAPQAPSITFKASEIDTRMTPGPLQTQEGPRTDWVLITHQPSLPSWVGRPVDTPHPPTATSGHDQLIG